MSTKDKDCYTCLHSPVCKFTEHFYTLQNLGAINFNCNNYLFQNVIGDVTDHRSDSMSMTERFLTDYRQFSNEDDIDKKDNEIKKHEGECAICGKKTTVYTCNECGRDACGECGELTAAIDIDSGDFKDAFVCNDCEAGDA